MTLERPSIFNSPILIAWLGTGLTGLLLFFSFGPVGHPFVALFALIPAILATTQKIPWKIWRQAAWGVSWILWIALLIWLRHVYPPLGYIGLVLLTAYCALYLFLWLIALRWFFPATENASLPIRLLYLIGLAGAWGLLEWVRSIFLTGFGWLPLSASQEGNPVLLSLCAWVGPYGLSTLLVLINLGFASWIFRLKVTTQSKLTAVKPLGWFSRLTPELYICLSPVVFGFIACGESLVTRADLIPFTAGVVQTDFDPNAKWDSVRLQDHIEKIESLTFTASQPNAKGERPDFILWPEAALPISLASQPYINLLTRLAIKTETPLIIGTIDKEKTGYTNSVAVITSEGLQRPIYSKRHLVPFGEYVPFANILPLRKVVPISEDCVAGRGPNLFPITNRKGQTAIAGALICYEDVFPELAREHALAGANLLVVVTNDAWYGREAGAYQHNAHSILLAASTGLPVIRCGNAGWSGTINRFGQAKAMTQNESIYFAGQAVVGPLFTQKHQPETFWVQHGDWAVAIGGLFFAFAYIGRRRQKSIS